MWFSWCGSWSCDIFKSCGQYFKSSRNDKIMSLAAFLMEKNAKYWKNWLPFWKFWTLASIGNPRSSLSKLIYKYTIYFGNLLPVLMDILPSLSLTKCGNNICTPSPICQDLYFLVCSLSTTVCKVIPLFLVGFSGFWLQIQVLCSYKVLLSYNLQPKCSTIIYIYIYVTTFIHLQEEH